MSFFISLALFSWLASALANDFFYAGTEELVSLCIHYYFLLAIALTNEFF